MAAKRPSKITCRRCSKEKVATRDFYSTKSELYNSIGRIDICKDCILEMYNKLLTLYDGKSNESFRHLCLLLDVYYSEEIYQQCVGEDNFIGQYMRNINSKKETKEKTSFNNKIDSIENNDVALGDGNIINEDIITRWGRNRKYEDYMLLEKRYKQKIEDYPSKKPAEKSILRSMCLLELDIEEARVSDKKSVPALEKTLSDKFKQLGINPSDDKMYDEQSMLMFGVIMGIIENDYPVMDEQGIYKDVDGMNWYWYRNLIVPTMKAWDMANGDYSLDDGIKNIEIKPEIKALMEDKGHGE